MRLLQAPWCVPSLCALSCRHRLGPDPAAEDINDLGVRTRRLGPSDIPEPDFPTVSDGWAFFDFRSSQIAALEQCRKTRPTTVI